MDAQERSRKRTRKACTACRKAKTSCSDQRPCTRCVRLKKEDQCIDIPATSTMSDRDRETWVRVANFLRDPSSMPPHVAEALEQQVSLVLAEPSGSKEAHRQPEQQLQVHQAGATDEQELRRLREANSELQTRLQAAMAKLEHDQAVQHSFYFFGLTTNTHSVAISHWSFPSTQLIHYNAKFRDLSGREDIELSAPNFTCKRLFMEMFVQRCVKILMFLSHGTVSSITVPQVWKNNNGEPVNVTSMVYIEVDRDSGHVAKTMMASTPAGDTSAHHKFDTAFIPTNPSFNTESPMNQLLLEECRDGIMQQIYEARATPPPASVSQGWSSSAMQSAEVTTTSATSPEFGSPEAFHSSSPSSAHSPPSAYPLGSYSPDSLASPQAVESLACGAQQSLPIQVASWGSPQQPQQPQTPQPPQAHSPAFYDIGALPEIGPATVRSMPQSQVAEMLKADLAQEPWGHISPERDSQVPSLPMPAFVTSVQQMGTSGFNLSSGLTDFEILQA